MKVNAAKHAEAMAASMGVHQALVVSLYYVERTKPEVLADLPKGEVYMEKLDSGSFRFNPKSFNKLHNFWKNCSGVLAKKSGLKKEEIQANLKNYVSTLRESSFVG